MYSELGMNRHTVMRGNSQKHRIKSLCDNKMSDFSITVNYTNDTAEEWATLFTAAKTAKNGSKATWIEIYHPSLTNAFFVSVELPSKLPVPEMGQNELLTVEIGCTVVDFTTGAAVKPTAA